MLLPTPAYATRVRYIESTGTQWIDTGVQASSPVTVALRYAIRPGGETNNALFGAFEADASGGRLMLFITKLANGKNRIQINPVATSATAYAITDVEDDTVHRLEVHFGADCWWRVDGGSKTTKTGANTTVGSRTLWICNRSSSDAGRRNPIKARIYSAEIYDASGSLVRSFVPMRVGQSGYLFDRVSGQLFGNAGTGSFVLGPDTFQQGVVPTRMMVAGVRKKAMKFIRSTGTYYPSREVTNNGSYLNTGINPDAQTSIEIICRVTPGSTFQHWAYLLGAQTANDNANTFSVRGLSTSQVSPPWRNYRWGHSSWQDFGITTYSWSGSSDWHTISISRSGLVLDGVLYSATGTTNTSVPGKPIFIGCINRNGRAQNCIPLDIASLKIWSGTTLQFDGTPNVVNGVAGLKDSVSGSLFSSSSASNPYQLLQELVS